MYGFYTQRSFHRVQEHPKRSSDEEVMHIRSWRVDIVQGLRYSVESHAIAYPRMHPATLRRGFHAPACQRMHPTTLRRARGCLGNFGTRPFSTRNHPGTTLVHRRQYPPNLDYMICHKHGTKTILQSIPIHPKSRNNPTSISIHILKSILKGEDSILLTSNYTL